MMNIFTWADYVIIAIIGISVLISIIRGFIREVLSLIVWIAAFFIAFKFSSQVAAIFSPYIDNNTLRLTISFAILFLIVLILGGLISYLISILIAKTKLTLIDRTLGIIFGFIRGVLVVAVLLLLLSVHTYSHEDWWADSYLIPHFKNLITWLHQYFPQTKNKISNVITPEITS